MKKICIITLASIMLMLTGCSSSSEKAVETDNKFYEIVETGAAGIKDYYDNQDENDKKAAQGVIDQINGLGEITVDSANSISTVRAAYDALTDEQKKLVTNYKTLTDDEEKLKSKKDEKANESNQKELVTNDETPTNDEDILKSKQEEEQTNQNSQTTNNQQESNQSANEQTKNNQTTSDNSSKEETPSKLACTAANAQKYMNKSINSFMADTGVYRSGTEDCLNPDGLAYSFDGFTVYTNESGNIIAVE
ncbi:MAG: hypothetical protein SOY42_10985 [Clostridium sp.]|nr:hypothetical protein [Clostridium sp.]